ncbi:MAG: SGNH/GDSL hydrolase family protein, partial [Deltaproteobacteria bacterium]|nr:SGNH/GDSL hydrolase family protein [Deltaproteobacteria bacterium]
LQEVETLRTKGMKYDPDIVFLTFCLNDFLYDSNVYEALKKKNGWDWPLYEIYSSLLKNSRLAFVIYNLFVKEKTPYIKWYSKKIAKGKNPAEAGFELFAELRQKHAFSAGVLILPAFAGASDNYEYGPLHEMVFKEAGSLPGIRVIDLLPYFREVNNDLEVFSYDGLHLNEYGHRTLAQILFSILEKSPEDLLGEP